MAERQQLNFYHQKNCQCSCNCNMFDESQYNCLNQDLLKNLNSQSVHQLQQKYREMGFPLQNFQDNNHQQMGQLDYSSNYQPSLFQPRGD